MPANLTITLHTDAIYAFASWPEANLAEALVSAQRSGSLSSNCPKWLQNACEMGQRFVQETHSVSAQREVPEWCGSDIATNCM
jgi:hypothetical protein